MEPAAGFGYQGRTDADAEQLFDVGRRFLFGLSGFGEGRVLDHPQDLWCEFRGPATIAHGYAFGSRESFGDSCLETG